LSFVKFGTAKAALYKGLNKTFVHFIHFYPIWKKDEARIAYKNKLNMSFLNIGAVNAIRFIGEQKEFLSVLCRFILQLG
jgi:hypothetical protein